MKHMIVLFCALSLVAAIFSACEKKPPEDQVFAEAKKLQEEGKYPEAVAGYEKLVQLHPRGKFAPQSQFMIGFIYANELKDLAKAEKAYKFFLEKYSATADSGMVASAQWELKYLGKDINDIDDLSIIMKKDATADTTKPAEAGKPQ